MHDLSGSALNRDIQIDLLTRLLAQLDQGGPEMKPHDTQIPVRNYVDPKRVEEERQTLFRRLPLVLGHASQLKTPGDCITSDGFGLPVLATRDRDGVLRAFLNVCRHRGTKLMTDACGHDRKSFVCPFHGWTYDLSGQLTHIPRSDGFPGVDRREHGLVPLPITSRHGLLWIHPTPGAALELDRFVAPFEADLEGLGLERHRIYRKVTERKRANWKLVIDTFLEGYHVPHLHQKTVHRFFRNLVFLCDRAAPHMRVAVSRTTTRDLRQQDPQSWDIRAAATLYYFFFPNTIVLFNPDYVSVLRLFPDGPDHCIWDHEMLIPEADDTEEMRGHWQKSFELMEEAVFQKEDIAAAESIQAGLRSGANEVFSLGRFEFMIQHFHDDIEAQIAKGTGR